MWYYLNRRRHVYDNIKKSKRYLCTSEKAIPPGIRNSNEEIQFFLKGQRLPFERDHLPWNRLFDRLRDPDHPEFMIRHTIGAAYLYIAV